MKTSREIENLRAFTISDLEQMFFDTKRKLLEVISSNEYTMFKIKLARILFVLNEKRKYYV